MTSVRSVAEEDATALPDLPARLATAASARPMLAGLEQMAGVHAINRHTDPKLVREVAGRLSAAYANSWMYLTQAADSRGVGGEPYGYMYFDGERMASIGLFERPYDLDAGTLHFHVIRPVGAWTTGQIESLCADLRDISGQPVYLKKFGQQEAVWLRGGRFHDAAAMPWHSSAPFEDDSYPEAIVDLSSTLRLLTGSAGDNELRRKLRIFERKVPAIERVEYTPCLFSEATRVVQGFFTERKDLSSPENYWNMLETLPDGRHGQDYFAWLYRIERRPAALFLADRIGSANVGVYANLTTSKQDYPYLSEYLLINEFRRLAAAGIYTANLGGSETSGLYAFKRKFRPAAEVEMKWLIYS